LDYYSEITQNIVGRVLTNRQVVKRDEANHFLLFANHATSQWRRFRVRAAFFAAPERERAVRWPATRFA
jgi:hypothetical protein